MHRYPVDIQQLVRCVKMAHAAPSKYRSRREVPARREIRFGDQRRVLNGYSKCANDHVEVGLDLGQSASLSFYQGAPVFNLHRSL